MCELFLEGINGMTEPKVMIAASVWELLIFGIKQDTRFGLFQKVKTHFFS